MQPGWIARLQAGFALVVGLLPAILAAIQLGETVIDPISIRNVFGYDLNIRGSTQEPGRLVLTTHKS